MGCSKLTYRTDRAALKAVQGGLPRNGGTCAGAYRYGFNGMEKENAVNEDGYDFGARLYNSWNGKWMAVDPLAAKYPGISTYAFVANSPIIFVDPDGRVIRIYYDGGYFDFNGLNSNDVPKDGFVEEFLRAYFHDVSNGGGFVMIEAAFSDNIYEVVKTDKSSNVNTKGIIEWNPESGALVVAVDTDGNERWAVLSPATVLEHEFDHKSEDKLSDRLKEESRVITGSETTTARANNEISDNEVVKDTYRYNERMRIIVSGSSISTRISKRKTKEMIQKLDEQGRETEQYNILNLD
jgi:RHS repeat-associated protein